MYGGTFRIVNGTVYGTNESDASLRNTAATNGAALFRNTGTAQRGTFSGETWNSMGDLISPFNATLKVNNGELIVPNSFTVSNFTEYNTALDVIRAGGDDRSYTINITQSIGGITPLTGSPTTSVPKSALTAAMVQTILITASGN